MIIKKIEAKTTKLALQDIAKTFGENSLIVSNTRNDGRNIVYFALDSFPENPRRIERRAKAPSENQTNQKSSKGSRIGARTRKNRIDDNKTLNTDGATDLSASAVSAQLLQLSTRISQLTEFCDHAFSSSQSDLQRGHVTPSGRTSGPCENMVELRLTKIEQEIMEQTLELKNVSLMLQQGVLNRHQQIDEGVTHKLEASRKQGLKVEGSKTMPPKISVSGSCGSLRIVLSERCDGPLNLGALLDKTRLNDSLHAAAKVFVFAGLGWTLRDSGNQARTFADQTDLRLLMAAHETDQLLTVFVPVREYLDWVKDLAHTYTTSIDTLFSMGSERDLTVFLTELHHVKLTSQYRLEDVTTPPDSIAGDAKIKTSDFEIRLQRSQLLSNSQQRFDPSTIMIAPAAGKKDVRRTLMRHIFGVLGRSCVSFSWRGKHV
jgi:hypothetical protein